MTFSTTDFGYFIVLEPGDELLSSLIRFAREQELDSAMVTAIGSVSEVELGTGSSRDRDQQRRLLTEPLQTCSLTGTVTLVDGEPFPHLHGSFARSDHSVVGGHVYQAVCETKLEISLQAMSATAAFTTSQSIRNGTST